MRAQIIVPGTWGKEEDLRRGLTVVRDYGLDLSFSAGGVLTDQPEWPYAAGSVGKRLREFNDAASQDLCLWAARGGYGCSDLLEGIDYEQLRSNKTLVVGFSDVSALHAAVYSKTGLLSLHAPMLASELWQSEVGRKTLLKTVAVIKGEDLEGHVSLTTASPVKITGRLFGGCLSVLTNLIGTPFFPASLDSHILFFEDIAENPGKMWRNLLQWQQCGHLKGVQAIVLGDCVDTFPSAEILGVFQHRLSRLAKMPVFLSKDFGHVHSNWPLMVGSQAEIDGARLTWSANWRSGG